MYEFPPTPEAAQQRLDLVNPRDYAHTRHALVGAVTHLSPYLTHGFLSVPDVAHVMYHQHRLGVQHKFIFELGWREYYQHLHQHLGEGIAQPLREGLLPESNYAHELPEDVRHACTRVPAIDQAIRMLYTTGYLHNHARLWLASYIVHLRKVNWRIAADWMYSHLLDGDLASNYLNWQWVAATGSSKPYLFNADNVEQFAPEAWHSRGTAIDVSYETLEILATNPATRSDMRDAAHALMASDGKAVSVIQDSGGFVTQRVVATIVNIASDMCQQGICSPADLDTAVTLGLGYPMGPLALGDRLGADNLLEVLFNLQTVYGDPRYRPSPWLRRRGALGLSLSHLSI